MRHQVIDSELRYACHSCGGCCNRPWFIMLEKEEIETIRDFDWGAKYPHLRGKRFFKTADVNGKKRDVLTKDDRGACIFYNHENRRCIVHAELGPEAKPHICRQYPINVSPAPDADRVYVHFACPSVQADRGPTLIEQQEDIRKLVKPTKGWKHDGVPFVQGRNISTECCRLLQDRTADLFDAEERGDLWERFAKAIQLAVAVGRAEPEELEQALGDPAFGADVPDMELSGYASLRQSPLTPRMLLSINLWTDLFPVDSLGQKIRLAKRISMTMKLFQMMQMRGTYASRLLKINIPLSRLDSREIVGPIPPDSSDLLRRWIRSRLVAHSFAIYDLTIMAGLHELILDLNAVIFMARSQAVDTGAPPTDEMYADALTLIESDVAAQRRLYRILLPGWTLSNLDSPDAAWSSLRLFHPRMPTETEPVREEVQAAQA